MAKAKEGSNLMTTPRHAKERNPIWSYIALGGYFAIAGFIGAFLGTLLANIL